MRLACFLHPHRGGTFSVYRQLRAGLAPHGIEVRWVGLGEEARRALDDPAFAEHRAAGLAVDGAGGPQAQAEALARALDEEGFDGVFANVGGDVVQANLVRYLPSGILRILVVHNISPGVYAAARALRDSVHGTVGVSRRIRDDLVARHGFDPARTTAIPNATELAGRAPPRVAGPPGRLRVLALGRVEDGPKGVLWLPDILRRLPEAVTLTVAGDGPDLARLKARCAFLGPRAAFLGAVDPCEAGALFARHDAMLAPSRFEGCPVALMEAMATGCVPVTSRLRGVTDDLVADGRTGFLFPVGDTAAAARALGRLHADPALLGAMAAEARAEAAACFRVDVLGAAYHGAIRRAAAGPPPAAAPLDLAQWRLPAGLRPSLRTYLPAPVKNWFRTLKERIA